MAVCPRVRLLTGEERAIRSNALWNRRSLPELRGAAPALHRRSEQTPPCSEPGPDRKPYEPPLPRQVCSLRPHGQRVLPHWPWQTAPEDFSLPIVRYLCWLAGLQLARFRERECWQNP